MQHLDPSGGRLFCLALRFGTAVLGKLQALGLHVHGGEDPWPGGLTKVPWLVQEQDPLPQPTQTHSPPTSSWETSRSKSGQRAQATKRQQRVPPFRSTAAPGSGDRPAALAAPLDRVVARCLAGCDGGPRDGRGKGRQQQVLAFAHRCEGKGKASHLYRRDKSLSLANQLNCARAARAPCLLPLCLVATSLRQKQSSPWTPRTDAQKPSEVFLLGLTNFRSAPIARSTDSGLAALAVCCVDSLLANDFLAGAWVG